MSLTATIREQILMQLVQVIDPETGIDVLRMSLVEELEVDETPGLSPTPSVPPHHSAPWRSASPPISSMQSPACRGSSDRRSR
jgi:hypothetical protein